MIADDDYIVPPKMASNTIKRISVDDTPSEPIIKKKRNIPGRLINKLESIKIFKKDAKSKEKYALKRRKNTELELEPLDHDNYLR